MLNTNDVLRIIHGVLNDPIAVSPKFRYAGVHVGFVEDVSDPSGNGRVRVRVPHIHGSVETVHIPWAVRCFPDASINAGSVSPLRPSSSSGSNDGDRVFVMFEGCEQHLPVVLGHTFADGAIPPEAIRGETQARRHVFKSRHGTQIVVSDEKADAEVKVIMPSGMILHMRESDGGRGIHVNTSGGHVFSMQDEESGDSQTPSETPYDLLPDIRYATVAGRQELPTTPQKAANGVVQTGTGTAAEGFGQKGVCIRTAAGNVLEMRDVSDTGIEIRTPSGHVIEINDAQGRISARTIQGNTVVLQDGSGVLIQSQNGQTLQMLPTEFGLFWPDKQMQIRFGGGVNEWNIIGNLDIRATGNLIIHADGNMDVDANGVLTERGGGGRVEIPEVGP